MSNRAVAELYRISNVFARRRDSVETDKKALAADRKDTAVKRTSPVWVSLETNAVEIVLVMMGFLLGRACLLGSLYPFGLAYGIAVARTGIPRRVAIVAMSIIAGITMTVPFPTSLVYTAFTILLVYMGRKIGMKKESDASSALLVFAGIMAIRLISRYIFKDNMGFAGSFAIEAILAAALTQVYTLGIRFWFRFHRSQPLSTEELFSATILAVSSILGIADIHYQNVGLEGIVSRFLIMIASTVGGPAMGSALGVMVGLAAFISGKQLIGLYALSGLIGGCFKEYGRLPVAGGFILADLIFSVDMARSEDLTGALLETAVAAAVLLGIPKVWLAAGAKLAPGTAEHINRQTLRERRLRELVSRRLKDFSGIFNELSHTFHQGSPVEGAEAKSFNGFLENIVRRNCLQCTGYNACWHDKLYKSYLMMVDLLALAETKGKVSLSDLPDGLHNKCIQPNSLVNAVNGAVEVYQTENQWEKRLRESREIVSSQLRGVSRIMNGLSSEIKLDLCSQEEMESNLKEELVKRGVNFDDVLVTDRGDNRIDVTVELPGCDGNCLCANVIAPMAGRTLGKEFSVWNAKCALEKPGSRCSFELVPQRRFDVVTSVVKAPKSGSVISGDAHAVLDLPGGKTALVLSDGMGVGPRAALESGATIAMLRKLIDAGFERDFAIRTINSVLLLRSPEETFSTIDMVIVDLHSGQGEFLKIGSAPSYLKRGRDVRTVKSSTLPVGILNTIDVESCTLKLKHGDMLVMVTDGAVDAVLRHDKEEWIASALKKMDTTNPKEIANAIFSMVKKESGKQTADDVTILVAKILKHETGDVRSDESGIQTLNTGHYAS